MNEEEMQNCYIEMLIQDLEKHSFEYWESTQDEMVEALRNLQQEKDKYEFMWNELNKWLRENESFDYCCNETTFTDVLNKTEELEKGVEKDDE